MRDPLAFDGDSELAWPKSRNFNANDIALVLETDRFAEFDDQTFKYEGVIYEFDLDIWTVQELREYAINAHSKDNIEFLVESLRYYIENDAFL